MKKAIIFISGAVFLSAAWMGITSSVRDSQESLQQETLPVKFGLVQSRWEKLANFKVLKDGELVKPADFVFRYSGLDLELVESKVSWGVDSEIHLAVKRAYLDAGPKALFFTLDLKYKGTYLVRVLRENGEVEASGFPLDTILNYLGQGLERDEWFLLDGRHRVVASSEKSYVGESYKAGDNFRRFKFSVSGEKYIFASLKPSGVNLALVNFMGVCGLCLIFFALYIYTGGVENEQQAFVNAPRQEEPEEGFFEKLNQNRHLSKASAGQKSLEAEIYESLSSEDVRMVDLTVDQQKSPFSEEGSRAKLDYAEFLIENPLLGEAPAQAVSVAGVVEFEVNQVEVAKEDEELLVVSSADDWIKLAEDLSANIDKFTQALGDSKSPENNESEIERVNV